MEMIKCDIPTCFTSLMSVWFTCALSVSFRHAVERLHLVIKTETKFVPPDEFRQWQVCT